MARVVLVAMIFIGGLQLATSVQAGSSCTCHYFGQHLKVGTKICMKSWKGWRMATCGFVLNNTSWRISDQKCEVNSSLFNSLSSKTESVLKR